MDKNYCNIIDDDNLVEKFVNGDLHGEILNQFTEHLKECEAHSQAVTLEKALKRGVRDYARSELKSNLRGHIKKQEISKYYILRYAAILIVAIMAPIILYYQFGKHQVQTEIAQEAKKVPPKSVASRALSKADEEPSIAQPESRAKEINSTASGSVSDIALTKPDPEISAKTESLEEIGLDLPTATPVSVQKSARSGIPHITFQDEFYIDPEESAHKDSIYSYIKSQEQALTSCIPEKSTIKNNYIIIELSVSAKGVPEKISIGPEGVMEINIQNCMLDKIKSWQFQGIKDTILIRKKIQL